MTERIDHAAEARKILELVTGLPKLDEARVHATLALVEQQRIANLIALSQAEDGNGWQAEQPLAALFAYRREAGAMEDEGLHIRPEIAVALGIGQEVDRGEE